MTTQYKLIPSEPTDEMVTAGVAAWLYQENPNKPINFVEIFKAMWEKATEVEQEPVAYRNFNQGEGGYEHPWLYVDADDLVGHTYSYIRNAEPLYTHPQPKQPEQSLDMVKREPLSNNAIQQLIVNNGGSMLEFARAIEKAHGIE